MKNEITRESNQDNGKKNKQKMQLMQANAYQNDESISWHGISCLFFFCRKIDKYNQIE